MNILLDIQQVLGKSPTKPDPDIYEHRYIHCDVLLLELEYQELWLQKLLLKII